MAKTPSSGTRRGKGRLVAEKRRAPLAEPRGRKTRAKTAAAKPARPRRGLLGWVLWPFRVLLRLIWALAWRGAVIVALIVAGAVAYNYARIPDMASLADGRARGSVTMADRSGEVFAWRGDNFGGLVTTEGVSEHLKNAVVASEDKRFYRHLGISPRGIAGAMRTNIQAGRGPFSGSGGSTITQQVAKLLCLGTDWDPSLGMTEAEFEADCRRGTVWRKVKEIPYALALELKFTKDEILAIYLNRAYLGAGARGFAAAAQRYFGTSVARLNPQQSAMLSGLLPAPSYFAPTANLERAQERGALVLGLMHEQGYLSSAEYQQALANPATLSPAARQDTGGYFADWVMQTGPDFLTQDTTEDVLMRTTLDKDIQRAAEEALEYVFETKVREGSEAQAAIVVMSADGAVRAMVGGRNTRGAGQFNRATQAIRQTGSAFKPFVYAAALDLGWTYDSTVYDGPLSIQVPGSGTYSPENYSREFYGEVTLTEALARSLNTAAVRLSENVGRDIVRKVAADFGLDREMADGPALALGVSEATLLEMTGAYAGILNGGTSVTPYGLKSLTLRGDTTPLLDHDSGLGERVIQTDAARQLVYMMSRVVEEGTGTRAKLDGRPAAGKTGTTQAARDAWFVGFTGDYVAGVWMGYDDNTPLTGVTGGGLPAEIWHETMERVHAGTPVTPLPMIDPARTARPAPQAQSPRPAPQPQPEREPDLAERILRDVLGTVFGRN
ncbi:transglycosylase domain-containing protein [Jannaschia seohaensis]|uniref:peptidoglycan glycosyltransferase n=1 Tax=Jannaschia seohaensis TaxID=475081 RepID=A0A2Y9A8H9_9RHOB|nr:transglycosylase domain-containing protein [Jannaschia seohaensis]PWJ22219.1 penicillin-binding protein 1A [Jannaschia seohaensis]SSA38497.1 penicillin-binding protein 1A [Jannaschia seohaensis]